MLDITSAPSHTAISSVGRLRKGTRLSPSVAVAIWSKAVKKLSTTHRDSVLQNPEAFRVRVWRQQLQWQFLPTGKSREDVGIVIQHVPICADSVSEKMKDIPAADAVFTTIEQAGHIDPQYRAITKMGKVMYQISEIKEVLRGDAEYNFRDRAKKLVVKWGL
ncbi:hypothetical protein B0H14DRAFT_3778311 [Mycena olivaceomarginata]|nr:hypothetical protein B0H14DRAFT_3778311 [Mycena olivaceomarginata]